MYAPRASMAALMAAPMAAPKPLVKSHGRSIEAPAPALTVSPQGSTHTLIANVIGSMDRSKLATPRSIVGPSSRGVEKAHVAEPPSAEKPSGG